MMRPFDFAQDKPFEILAVVIACCACLPSRVDAQADPRQNPLYKIRVDRGWAVDLKTKTKTIRSYDGEWAVIETPSAKGPSYRTATIAPQPNKHGKRVYRAFGGKYETFARAVEACNLARGGLMPEPPGTTIILKPSQLLEGK